MSRRASASNYSLHPALFWSALIVIAIVASAVKIGPRAERGPNTNSSTNSLYKTNLSVAP